MKTKKTIDFSRKIIDFSQLLDRSTEGFVGRQWVRDAVDAFLRTDNYRYFLLLGEPGSGKTAFMADLVRQRGYPHHFIGKGSQVGLLGSLDWRDPVRFAESIGYQLICDYGGWIMSWEDWGISVEQEVKELKGLLVGAKVREFRATPRPAGKPKLTVQQKVEQFGPAAKVIGIYINKWKTDVEQIVRQMLMTPLRNIADHLPEHQVVIIVDGLDEAKYYSKPERNILKMMPDGSLPDNIRFLLSSRPGEHITPDFRNQAQVFWLSEDEKGQRDPRTIQDAKAFVLKLAGEKQVNEIMARRRILPDTLAEQVANASQGNFLYLHHYAKGLRQKDETLLNLEALPQGLYGIYEDFMAKIKERVGDAKIKNERGEYVSFWNQAYLPILGTMAVAREPLTRRQITDFSKIEQETVATILVQLTEFLDIIGERAAKCYSIYHRSFAEYLVSEESMDYIDDQKAHRRIVDYYQERDSSWKEAYAMKYLLSHMIAAQSWDDLKTLLTNIEYLEKNQSPAEQYNFQNDFIVLLQTQEIPTIKLVDILEGVLKAICEQLPTTNEKADWLDTFAYWINEFRVKDDTERSLALKDVANKFDYACGDVSKELAKTYLNKGENGWALRFAELWTWVYERAGDYDKCADACRYAEKTCLQEGMEDAYQYLGQAEFIRLRAHALTTLSRIASESGNESRKIEYEGKAHEAYEELTKVFPAEGGKSQWPTIHEWKELEELLGKNTNEVLIPPSQARSDKSRAFRAKVVSNLDDISAMHVIQFFEEHDGLVEWIHHKNFEPEQFAPEDTLFTVLIGGPKTPGISKVAYKFYETDKEGFLRMYSGSHFEASRLNKMEGKTHCYMLGGPSKVNTLMAAYEFTKDSRVMEIIKKGSSSNE